MLTTLLVALLLTPTASAVPLELTQQGRLMDSGGIPLDGDHDIDVALFDVDTGGTALWSDSFAATPFDQGYYVLDIGSGVALDPAAFDGDDVWLELTVDGGTPLPRIKLASVPYAIRARGADTATDLSGGVVDATEIRVNGTTVIDGSGNITGGSGTLGALTCNADEVAVFDGTDWQCGPNIPAHDHDAANVATGVLDILRLPVGTGASDVAAGDHLHALSQLTGVITDAQLPVNMGSVVDGYVVDGPLDLDGGSTLGGATISTGAHYTDADAISAVGPHYTDADAISAVGPHYTDADAISAVGPHYTDADAISAVGPHFTDADAVAAVDTRRVAYHRYMTGGWLEANATFVRNHSETNGRLDIAAGAGGNQKQFEVPLLSAGDLDPASTWVAHIRFWTNWGAADNDILIGLADSTDFIGVQRLDNNNNLGVRGYEGVDGNSATSLLLFGAAGSDPGPTQRYGEVTLRMTRTETEMVSFLPTANAIPAYGTATRVLNAEEDLKLAVFANDAGETYQWYAIEVEIYEEGP